MQKERGSQPEDLEEGPYPPTMCSLNRGYTPSPLVRKGGGDGGWAGFSFPEKFGFNVVIA